MVERAVGRSRSRHRLFATVLVVAAWSSGCDPGSSTAPSEVGVSDAVTTGAGTAEAITTPSPSADTPGEQDLASAVCARDGTEVAGALANEDIDEASGLVASRTHPGVYWTHDDGPEATLYAVGSDGSDLGAHPLDVDGAVDVEDIAITGGPDGSFLLLADIGDNQRQRARVRLYRVAEPDPAVPGPVGEVEVLEFTYPDRPYNAETLLVDEVTDSIVIVTKEQEESDGEPDALGAALPSTVFEGPLDPQEDGPVELRRVGTIDVVALQDRAAWSPPHPTALIGLAGVPTGGDVSPDGSLVAIRTYSTVWLWTRDGRQTVAEALQGEPCEVTVAFEQQGEAVAFDAGGLATVGEGGGAPLHLIAR